MSIEIKFVLELLILVSTCTGFIFSIRGATKVMKEKCEHLDKRLVNIEKHKEECDCAERISKCETCITFLEKGL